MHFPALHGYCLAGDEVYIIPVFHRHLHLGALPLQREDAELFLFPVVAQADGDIVRVIGFRGKPVSGREVCAPHGVELLQQRRDVLARAREHVLIEEARQPAAGILLPAIEQYRALEEIQQRREVPARPLLRHKGGDARHVVVFHAPQLHIVFRVHGFLEIQHVHPRAERLSARDVFIECLADVVFILHVERGIQLVIRRHGNALLPVEHNKAPVHRFGKPQAPRMHLFHGFARLAPELRRNERGDVAPEAVHDPRPIAEMPDLRVPKRGAGIVKVDDVRPFSRLVAEAAVRLAIVKLRMLGDVYRVRRRVVVHHVDDALHAARVDCVHERPEIPERTVFGVDRTVIAVGVGAAETAFLALLADGVNGQEPDDIRPQRADAVQIGDNGAERPLRRVVAHINAVYDLRAQSDIRILCHSDLSFAKQTVPEPTGTGTVDFYFLSAAVAAAQMSCTHVFTPREPLLSVMS